MSSDQGRPSVDLRTVLGLLLVKHIEGISDDRVIEYVQENIYAQYFVALSSFQTEPAFVPHLLVTIRERLGQVGSGRLNDLLLAEAQRVKVIKHRRRPSDQRPPVEQVEDSDGGGSAINKGSATEGESTPPPRHRSTVLLDATVVPVNIAYPTDSALLAGARRISYALLDSLYDSARRLWPTKPRTYRRQAAEAAVSFSKRRRKGSG